MRRRLLLPRTGIVPTRPLLRLRWLVASVAAVSVATTSNTAWAASQSSTMPRAITAKPLTDPTGGGLPRPISFGAPVQIGHDAFVAGPVFAGSIGWAVVWDGPGGNIAQYPIHTNDRGRTWTIAGPWLAITGAAGANVNRVTLFTNKVVVAYSKGMNVLDVTWDAGRRWYKAWMPGNIADVTRLKAASRPGSPIAMQTLVRSVTHPVTAVRYTSRSSGRKWRLAGTQWRLSGS